MATVEATLMDGSAGATLPVVRLAALQDGMRAECFGLLVRKSRGKTKRDEPFVKCYFRDREVTLESPVWANHRFHRQANDWAEGLAYRLEVDVRVEPRYGVQLDILNIRVASEALDAVDGYDFSTLVEGTDRPPAELMGKLLDCIRRYVTDPRLLQLVLGMLDEHRELFSKLQAAKGMHHSMTGGLLEHVWSLTRISGFLAEHYEKYYFRLDPPLDKGVIVAAAVLHDIGKLRELEYHPAEARYTTQGSLIGHVLLGRDMVREAASRIDGFPAETLLLLEHAILAHHGRREFGAPVEPQTVEALILAFADDLDAKVNAAARARMTATGDEAFTDKVYALNRRIYRSMPALPPAGDPGAADELA